MPADLEPEILEFDSFTETLLQSLAIGGGCVSCFLLFFLFAFRAEDLSHLNLPYGIAGGVAVSLAATWLRSKVDMTLLLDPQREQVLYRRKLFGWVTLAPLASFRELECVTEGGREVHQKNKPSYWEAALFLVTKAGRKIRASNYERTPRYTDPGKLAERLGIRFLSGGRQKYLVIRNGQAEHTSDDGSNRIALIVGGVLFLGFLVAIQLYRFGILAF